MIIIIIIITLNLIILFPNRIRIILDFYNISDDICEIVLKIQQILKIRFKKLLFLYFLKSTIK